MSAIEIENSIKRIASHKGVEGILVCNNDGAALKSTMSKELSAKYGSYFMNLIAQTRSTVRSINGNDDLVFLRIRTKEHELMVAPHKDFFLIVVQNPTIDG